MYAVPLRFTNICYANIVYSHTVNEVYFSFYGQSPLFYNKMQIAFSFLIEGKTTEPKYYLKQTKNLAELSAVPYRS